MPDIRVGTASWTDKSLLDAKLWYPPDARTPQDRLRFYASRFRFVEVDGTYYSLEWRQQAEAWVAQTPDDFVFDVKAFRLFTGHQTPPPMLPRDIRDMLGPLPEKKRNWYLKDIPADALDELWAYLRAALQPLRDAAKLGAVIFQLPPWAMPSPATRAQLVDAADRLDGDRLAVEFRNTYWLSDRRCRATLAFLREHGLALVIVDEPQGFRSSVPAVWEVTDPALAVVRLHGRNAATWEKKGLRAASERFRYEYSPAELAELAGPIRELARDAQTTHVTFNNNYQDMAQRNAEEFQRMLAAG
ncbi:MAG: DUF72 domain-containing protein [Dehalococcoidia bacterium]|nr:DUF72 domain-containing protein [Dehalococcoidia bacterium]